MNNTPMPILVCKHGQQARVCEMCDLERENARLLAVVEAKDDEIKQKHEKNCQIYGRLCKAESQLAAMSKQLAEARNEALEMAAKVCEARISSRPVGEDADIDTREANWNSEAQGCANFIRALKGYDEPQNDLHAAAGGLTQTALEG